MARKAKPGGWEHVWADEFDGTEVDRSKWDFDIGNGFFDYKSHTWIAGWGNEELQYYTDAPANVQVKDSVLTIRALKESLHGCGYTSARLKTRRRDGTALFTTLYGRVEFRARVPWGKGLWRRCGCCPQDDAYGGWAASGEIDLMEIVGERPHEVLNSLHFGSTYPARSLLTQRAPAARWQHGGRLAHLRGRVGAGRDPLLRRRPAHLHAQPLVELRQDGRRCRHRGAPRERPAPLAGAFRPAVLPADERGRRRQLPGVPGPDTQFPAELQVDHVRVYRKVGGYGAVKPRAPGRMPWHQKA